MRLTVRIRALRAMIAEFVFFVCIAAICFSGLLFTLHTLSAGGSEPWSWKSIAWLMVQVWFGNTYLSFAQASSFHPIFGPILMTGFAALSNTLLLTSKSEWHGIVYSDATEKLMALSVLISILSNTFARIDAVRTLIILNLVCALDPNDVHRTPTGRWVLCGVWTCAPFTYEVSAYSICSSSPWPQ